jgi:hypothetical protein
LVAKSDEILAIQSVAPVTSIMIITFHQHHAIATSPACHTGHERSAHGLAGVTREVNVMLHQVATGRCSLEDPRSTGLRSSLQPREHFIANILPIGGRPRRFLIREPFEQKSLEGILSLTLFVFADQFAYVLELTLL